jgi:hypothetical protein
MSHKPVGRAGGIGSARPQRMFQILTILYEQAFANDGRSEGAPGCTFEWMTTGQLARACRMVASPHFRGLLDELLGSGAIFVEARQYRSNMSVYVWRISENTRWSETWKAAFDAWLEPEKVLA